MVVVGENSIVDLAQFNAHVGVLELLFDSLLVVSAAVNRKIQSPGFACVFKFNVISSYATFKFAFMSK